MPTADSSWAARDFYAILGLDDQADAQAVKKAYRTLAREHHPDANPKGAERFKEIAEAYDVLGNTEKRAAYDALRRQPRGVSFGSTEGFDVGTVDINDLLKRFAGDTASSAPRFSMPGADLRLTASVTFMEAIVGKDLTVSHPEQGSLTIPIPALIDDGATFIVSGGGRASASGGRPGNLIVTMKVADDPIFTRLGVDITVKAKVTYTDLALGTLLEVPTLAGRSVKVKVEPGTPVKRTLKVKGRGVTRPGFTPGDLLVELSLQVPKTLSEAQRAALELLRAADQDAQEN